MCCVAGSAGEKDLLCLCLFRGVLDDVHALTGRGRGFIAAGKHCQVDVSDNSEHLFQQLNPQHLINMQLYLSFTCAAPDSSSNSEAVSYSVRTQV